MSLVVGVLALQGDVVEHRRVLHACGVQTRTVRRATELAGLDGLVIPGGESTTIDRLARITGLVGPLRQALREGLPAYGSCAGMIMLADRILDGRPDQEGFGGMDMTVRRNAFGRQVDSFETDLEVRGVAGGPMRAVFIRAPWVEEAGPEVEVLATVRLPEPAGTKAVVVRQGSLLASSFHPEEAGDTRLHAYFVRRVIRGDGAAARRGS